MNRAAITAILLALAFCRPVPASSAEPGPGRRLVVVVWERGAPQNLGRETYPQLLERNRTALLELLYGSEQPLIGEQQGRTVLAIYPEGLPSRENAPVLYNGLSAANEEQFVSDWLPQMVAMPRTEGGVKGLFYRTAPRRDVLDGDLRRNITHPLNGSPPGLEHLPETKLPEVTERIWTRGTSFPPIVTPWVLHDAATHGGAGLPFVEAYVVWVHAGDRNYELTIPDDRILEDLGFGALRYYRDVGELFSLSSDDSRQRIRRLGGGRLRVHRVRNRRTILTPPRLEVFDGHRPAHLSFQARWRTPPFGARTPSFPLFRSIDDLPRNRWSVRVSLGYRLGPGRFEWDDGRPATDMEESGRMADDLHSVISARAGEGGSLQRDLVADALAIPEREQVKPYLDGLWFPIASPVRAGALVDVRVRPIETWVYVLVVLLSAAGGVILWAIFRRRELHARITWPDTISFDLSRATDTTSIPVGISIEDRSGFPRRKAVLDVQLAITRSVTELEQLEGKSLYTVSPAHTLLSRPTRESEPMPVSLQVHGSAIDMRRLSAGTEAGAAVSLHVTVKDAKGKYRDLDFVSPFVFSVRILASDPDLDHVLTARAISPTREKGLLLPPPKKPERLHVGWTKLENRAPRGFVARNLLCRVTSATATLTDAAGKPSLKARCQLVPAGGRANDDGEWIRLRNGEATFFDVYLLLDASTFPAGAPHCDVECQIAAAFRIEGQTNATEQAARFSFRWHPFLVWKHACLDLGTSAVRLLLDGGVDDPERWGYALFDRPPIKEPPLNEHWPSEDLPSFALFERNGTAHLGQDALNQLAVAGSGTFRTSVKNAMIGDIPGLEREIRSYVKELFRKYYVPLTATSTTVRCPSPLAEFPIVAGDADVLVASVPNDCSAKYRAAYQDALVATNRFRHVYLLREAEAVALWYPSWRRQEQAAARSNQVISAGATTYEILIVDIGAGTTDTALARIVDPGGLEAPRVKIRSVGAAALAGRQVDLAIVEELKERKWIDRAALERLDERERLAVGERVKVAIAEREGFFHLPRHQLNLHLELEAEQLATLESSARYRDTVNEIARASLSVLLGRLPDDVNLAQPRTVILTGRGALIRGIDQAVFHYLESNGMTKLSRQDLPSELLKAAVSIGCRVFAANYWSEITTSSDVSMDRMLMVYRTPESVAAVEMLPVETPIGEAGPWVRIPPWSEAKLIATYLRRDAAIEDPDVRLSDAQILQILGGRMHPRRKEWHAPYSLLRGPADLPRSDEEREIEARVVNRAHGIELEQRIRLETGR